MTTLHFSVGSIWFAWGWEEDLIPFRETALKNLCKTNHGETCFVERISKTGQKAHLGLPTRECKVKHPQGIKEESF